MCVCVRACECVCECVSVRREGTHVVQWDGRAFRSGLGRGSPRGVGRPGRRGRVTVGRARTGWARLRGPRQCSGPTRTGAARGYCGRASVSRGPERAGAWPEVGVAPPRGPHRGPSGSGLSHGLFPTPPPPPARSLAATPRPLRAHSGGAAHSAREQRRGSEVGGRRPEAGTAAGVAPQVRAAPMAPGAASGGAAGPRLRGRGRAARRGSWERPDSPRLFDPAALPSWGDIYREE